VSLVAIIDADKEGFLRSARSLTQTVGRAARHLNGKAIMYADKITKSMQKTIDETNYRREKQLAFNEKHCITPTPLNKAVEGVFGYNTEKQKQIQQAAEPELEYMSVDQIQKQIRETRKAMEVAAKDLDFVEAARLRDLMKSFQDQLKA
jgi:excinuclease ABC subunit B